jgi:hypothetical protein
VLTRCASATTTGDDDRPAAATGHELYVDVQQDTWVVVGTI